jgi:[ribosomal protein S18]-alanine N-acetyltransferase
MIFQEMEKEDLTMVCQLEKQCFSRAWDKEDCTYEIDENPFSHGWILKDEDEIVGYAFLWETFEMAQLARIGVNPLARKKGYGSFLMQQLIERARNAQCEYMTLEVRPSNVAALALYKKFGFIQVNVSKNYYPDGEDALVMTMAL